MPDDQNPPQPPTDLVIKSVTAPSVVEINKSFDISVTVFAPEEDFEDQVGFRLFCYVCPCGGDGPKQSSFLTKGHVNETPPWTTPTATFTFTVTAGATSSVYNITAVLLEATKGIPDPGDPPSVFCTDCFGSVVVVDPQQ